MTRRKFDRFMVDNENGRNLKLMRLTDPEYRALFAGVLPIASKADVRGSFMVGKAPATAEDVVNQSPKTTRKTAESLLAKMREVGMLEHDDDLGGEWVHDWDKLNPAPKSDPTNADRQARWRARNAAGNATPNAASNGGANGGVTPPEVKKGKKETPQSPPEGGKVIKFDRKPVPDARLMLAVWVLNDFNQQAGTNFDPYTAAGDPSDSLKRIIGALTAWPDKLDSEYCRRLTAAVLKSKWWGGGPATVGVVFGPKVIEQNMARLDQPAANGGQSRSDWERLTGRTA